MQIICPKCKAPLESDDTVYGLEVECPECGHVFIVPKVIKLKKSKFNWGCYFLGVFLGLVGLLIAQITDGADGVKYAFRGFIIHLALLVGLTWALSSLALL